MKTLTRFISNRTSNRSSQQEIENGENGVG
jgi:hypothetical protein